MDFRDRSALIDHANRSVNNAAYDPRKLALIYGGVSTGILLLVTAANFILQSQIAGTGGLSGLALRSTLETAIQLLQLAVNVLLPFWSFGYLFCIRQMVRGQEFGPKSLLTGFQHFAPVLRLNLLRGGYLFLMAFLCFYPSLLIFSWTPLSDDFQQIAGTLLEETSTELVLDDAAVNAISPTLRPLLMIYGIVFLVMVVPKFYSYRMADYSLMAAPQAGAVFAIRRSTTMLYKKRLELLKLDLRFWWFYALEFASLALCYGDYLLEMLGIPLPLSPEVSYFLFYVLYLASQVALNVFARNQVEAAYCTGYECLSRELDEQIRQIKEEQNAQNPHENPAG